MDVHPTAYTCFFQTACCISLRLILLYLTPLASVSEENKVRGIIFGPEIDKIAGGWRRLHTEDIHNFYS
jgi:hypothetical protein